MLQSMELDDDQKLDAVMPIPMPDKPNFPYGLRICLTMDECEKLGIDPAEAAHGSVFTFRAMARITSAECGENDGGPYCRIEAQIEQMDVDGDSADETPQKSKSIYSKPMA